MKIIEIGTGYTPIPAKIGAATEIIVEELVEAFQKNNIDVRLVDISAHNRKKSDLSIDEVRVPKFLEDADVELGILHKIKRVIYSIALANKLKKILKTTEESIVLHFHNQYNLFFFLKLVNAKYRSKAHIAYTVHSYIWSGKWEQIKQTVKRRYFQEVYCVKKADCVFVLNDITKEHFIDRLGVEESKIHRIVNGVNTEKYSPLSEESIGEFKHKLGLEGRKIIFQVGSVCDRKNQLGAIKQLRSYLVNNKDAVFVFAGGLLDQEYYRSIVQYASENGIADKVIYAGELSPGEQLNLYYNCADVVIFPSKAEAFGLVIIEAISAGKPVLLMDKPYFRLNNGYSVYRTEEELIRNIGGCMKKIDMPSARNFVIENYGWNSVAEKHIETWRKACDVKKC